MRQTRAKVRSEENNRGKKDLFFFMLSIFALLTFFPAPNWGITAKSIDIAHKGQEHEKYKSGELNESEENQNGYHEEEDKGEHREGIMEEADLGEEERDGTLETTAEIILDPGRIFSHMHNKIVHFPIALGIVAGIFDILSFFNPAISQAGKIILAFTTAGAVGAFISGKSIEEEMEEEYTDAYKGVLEIHEALGLLAMSIYIIALLLRLSPKTQKFSRLLVILSVPLISFVGYLGGILAH